MLTIRKMEQLYGQIPNGHGLIDEGRMNMGTWKGSIQPPSFIIKQQTIEFLGWIQIVDPYLGPIRARKFKFEEELYVDVTDRKDELPQRIGTIAFWLDSYTEQLRKSLRMVNFISKTKIFSDLKTLAQQYKVEFLKALLIYYEGISKEGDFSKEQFIRDLTDKENSSSPFVDVNPQFKKNRDVLNAPDLDVIYAREAKETRSQLDWLIEHMKLAIDGRYEFKLIDPNFLINALRSRPVKPDQYEISIDKATGILIIYRARCAGGVIRISRLSWPIWHTPMKKNILSRMAVYLTSIFKLKLHLMDIESVAFYTSAAEAKINCFDVSNAEKTWGCVFYPNFPGIVDFSYNEKFNSEFAPALQSGIDITRIMNWFGTLLIVMWLREKGKVPKEEFECWMGGDNFGFKQAIVKPSKLEGEDENSFLIRMITEDDGLWHIIDTDDRILGFDPIKGRISGLHHSIDGVESMVSWVDKKNSFKWKQSRQTITRLLDSVIQLDIFKPGTCLAFYKWIIDKKLLDTVKTEIYNHDSIWSVTKDELMKESIPDKLAIGTELIKKPNVEVLFPGIIEWCRNAFTVDDNVTGKYVVESDATLEWYNSSSIATTDWL